MGFMDDLEKMGPSPPSTPAGAGDFQADLDRLGIKLDAATAAPAPSAPAAPQPQAPPDTDWSALPSHILQSAVQFAGNIGQAVLHPIQIAETVGDIGVGALQLLGVQGGEEYKPYAQAFGQMR
jgi:hypothetical protein